MDIRVGDILTMKKQHPCGEKRWEVLRKGGLIFKRCGDGGNVIGVNAQIRCRFNGVGIVPSEARAGHLATNFFVEGL